MKKHTVYAIGLLMIMSMPIIPQKRGTKPTADRMPKATGVHKAGKGAQTSQLSRAEVARIIAGAFIERNRTPNYCRISGRNTARNFL